MKHNRIPTSLRLDPTTVELIEKAELNGRGTQTDVIEGAVRLILNLSDRALGLLASTAKRTGKTETKLLDECILKQLSPGKANEK